MECLYDKCLCQSILHIYLFEPVVLIHQNLSHSKHCTNIKSLYSYQSCLFNLDFLNIRTELFYLFIFIILGLSSLITRKCQIICQKLDELLIQFVISAVCKQLIPLQQRILKKYTPTSLLPANATNLVELDCKQITCSPERQDVKENVPCGPYSFDNSTCNLDIIYVGQLHYIYQ